MFDQPTQPSGPHSAKRLRRLCAIGIMVFSSAVVGLEATPPAAANPNYPINVEYVALGDSFAAGPGILPVDPNNIDPCERTTNNYPHLLAARLNVTTFRDVTCSSAKTTDLTAAQQPVSLLGRPVTPQFNALTRETTLVTVTIGANDINLTGIATGCINLFPAPFGTSCKARLTAGGVDQGAAAVDTVAAKLATVVEQIHVRSPHATVVLTSYTGYLPPGGCYPYVPAWPQDADYVQGLVNRLGRVAARVAAEHDALYVDLISPAVGHDACQPLRAWTTGIVPEATGLVPMHPTLAGEQNFARIIADQLTQ